MFKFVRSATLAALLVGVALVIHGCGGGASASKKCDNGREVKASCSGDSINVQGSAPMEKAQCDQAKQQVDQLLSQQPGTTMSISCNGGKFEFTLKQKIPKNAKCTQESLDESMKNVCTIPITIAGPVAFSAETADDSINTARNIIAKSQTVADVLTSAPLDGKTTVQNLVATDANTPILGAPDELSKSVVAQTQQVFNKLKVAMHSNGESLDNESGPSLFEKFFYMAIGGLVVGVAFSVYHVTIGKHFQARDKTNIIPAASLEMAPSSCTA